MISSFIRTWKFIAGHPLTARNQGLALRRWLRWQFGSRILEYPVVVPFVEDSVLVVERGMTGATGNIYCGLHEFWDMAFVMHVLRPGDLFVDVGANIGSYTILAAKVVGADCLALEPVPDTFAKLQRNIRVNDLGSKVQSRQCAAGSGPGNLRFSVDKDTTNQVVDDHYHGQAKEVPVDSLDNLLGGKSGYLWKVDVEGFEKEVLAGAQKSLADSSLHAVLLEGNDAAITVTMETAGFIRANYEPWRREIITSPDMITRNNQLWVRGLEELRQRCHSAPKRMVLGTFI